MGFDWNPLNKVVCLGLCLMQLAIDDSSAARGQCWRRMLQQG
jgi:hypothetical protein